jgi:hypothetical protein
VSPTTEAEAAAVVGLSGDADGFASTDTAACLLIASVEAVMLLVNLQLATTSTVDGFQPVIEVACTVVIESRCIQASTVVDMYVILMLQVCVVRHYIQLQQRIEDFLCSHSKLSKNIDKKILSKLKKLKIKYIYIIHNTMYLMRTNCTVWVST